MVNVENQVAQDCIGRNFCSPIFSNISDPCPYTIKFMDTRYVCITQGGGINISGKNCLFRAFNKPIKPLFRRRGRRCHRLWFGTMPDHVWGQWKCEFPLSWVWHEIEITHAHAYTHACPYTDHLCHTCITQHAGQLRDVLQWYWWCAMEWRAAFGMEWSNMCEH